MDCQDYPMVEFYFKSWWCGHCTHCSWVCIWLFSLRTMLPRCICAHCRAYPLLFLCVHTTPVHFALHVTHLYLHLRSRCAISFCWSCPPSSLTLSTTVCFSWNLSFAVLGNNSRCFNNRNNAHTCAIVFQKRPHPRCYLCWLAGSPGNSKGMRLPACSHSNTLTPWHGFSYDSENICVKPLGSKIKVDIELSYSLTCNRFYNSVFRV